MTVAQTSQLMDLLSAAYPRYYSGQDKTQKQLALEVWSKMLMDYPASVVTAAVKALIATQKFPPAVSELVEKIQLITQPQSITEGEAWGLVQKAISNSGYHANEEFEKLPESIRRIVGSPSMLREWAMLDISELQTVVQSNFMRSFRAREQSDKQYAALPQDVKQTMRQLCAGVKRLEGPK